jgi:predicted transposase YbfD/YdcC
MAVPTLSILHHFEALEDPRIERTRKHLLGDILVLALCGVICDCDSFEDIELWAKCKHDWLKTFLQLPNGIPSHDTIGRVFAALDPKAFQECFIDWMNALWQANGVQRLHIDGKAVRRARKKEGLNGCLHLVSVWAHQSGLTLGQKAVAEGSNEIPAIPALLRTLELEGALVTIDAAGCQKEIAQTVRDQGGHYVLAVKGNQPTLYQDIQTCFAEAAMDDFAGVRYDVLATQEDSHGRLEERVCTVLYELAGLSSKEAWQDLKTVAMVYRRRQEGGKVSEQWSYYISSRKMTAKQMAAAVREHWGIENGLHWVLDVVFGEDQSRVRTGHAAENLAWVRKVALSLLRQDQSQGSLKGKRKRAGWDETFLLHLLGFLSEN